MQLTILASSAVAAVAYDGQIRHSFLQAGSTNTTDEENSAGKMITYQNKFHHEKKYGRKECPCIAIDGLEGMTWVQLKWPLIGEPYPADLGARCEAWDDTRHPKCKDPKDPDYAEGGPGKGNGWCSQKWCYVDACNCDIEVPPKEANYLPEGKYQGRDLFYSYHTCGAADLFAGVPTEETEAAHQKLAKMCTQPIDRDKWGVKSCSCVGIDGQPGNTVVKFDNGKTKVKYPADVGATCKAWDDGFHPECGGGGDDPAWCKKKWCYVDPCECDKDIWAAESYLGDATYQGKPLYFSYASCGERKADQRGITKASDIDKLCSNASSLKSFLAFVLLLLVSVN